MKVVPHLIMDFGNIGTSFTKFGHHLQNFVNDVPRVPKCVPRWGSTPNHFLMGSKMKLCTIHVQIGDPKTIGSDVPNLMKDVPNFVKDAPRVPNCIPRWGSTLNYFLMGC